MLQKEKDVAKTDSNDSDNRKKIDLPTPILRMDTSSTNESILPLVQLPSDDNTSTKESDQPLPPNDNIPLDLPSRQHDDTAMKMINNETATLLDMPLLSDDNTSYEESQMTSDQPPLKPGDTSMKIINEEITTLSDPPQSNKTFTIKSNHLSVKKTKYSHLPKDSQLPKDSHLPNGNEKVTMNGTGLVTSYSKDNAAIAANSVAQVRVLENKVWAMEQQARQCNIEISNLPERRNENLVAILDCLGGAIKLPIRSMLRDNVIAAYRATKGIDSTKITVSGPPATFY
ncbi:Zinc finger DNA binding protein, partial [Operophtera brumata]